MFSAYSAAFRRQRPPSLPLDPQDFFVPLVPTSVFAGPQPHAWCVGGRARPPRLQLPARREGAAPALRGAPCPCQLLPSPQAGRARSCSSGRAGGVPASAARSGVQASPFASTGAAAAPGGVGAARTPRAGRIRVRLLPAAAGHADVARCLPLL